LEKSSAVDHICQYIKCGGLWGLLEEDEEDKEVGGKTSLLGMKESADAINATLAAPASCINFAAALCPTLHAPTHFKDILFAFNPRARSSKLS
jgi:hypothetical protein